MKHPVLLVAATLVFVAPTLAQPNAGGPVQLRGPRRGGGFGGGNGGGGGGIASQYPSNDFSGVWSQVTSTPAPPPVSMVVDGPFLFILRGDTLMQFDKKTLKLLNTVELPRPANAPASAPDELKSHTAPPLRPGANFGVGPTF